MEKPIKRAALLSAIPVLLALAACSSSAASEDEASGDALFGFPPELDLTSYKLVSGTLAAGADARAIYADMTKRGGARDVGNGVLFAGLMESELGVRDATATRYGIWCTPSAADAVNQADTCSYNAIVNYRYGGDIKALPDLPPAKDAAGGQRFEVNVSGKLSEVIATFIRQAPPPAPIPGSFPWDATEIDGISWKVANQLVFLCDKTPFTIKRHDTPRCNSTWAAGSCTVACCKDERYCGAHLTGTTVSVDTLVKDSASGLSDDKARQLIRALFY